MDNLEYLKHISASNRPAPKNTASSLFSSPIFKIAIIGIVLFILLAAFGIMMGSLNTKPTELTEQLYLRTNSLQDAVSEYTPSLKSSQLRAIGTSLSTILSSTSTQLNTYLASNSNDQKNYQPNETNQTTESLFAENLNTSLNNAKLNGLLDRTYENFIDLQVSLLLSQTSQLLARTKDATLINILTNFESSLSAIHASFESYSSPSN